MANPSQFFPPWAATPKYRGELEVHKVGGKENSKKVEEGRRIFALLGWVVEGLSVVLSDFLSLPGRLSPRNIGCFFQEGLFVWSWCEFYDRALPSFNLQVPPFSPLLLFLPFDEQSHQQNTRMPLSPPPKWGHDCRFRVCSWNSGYPWRRCSGFISYPEGGVEGFFS